MLCQFSFSNFRSYRNETTLDFQAGNLTEFNDSLVGDNLLPVNVIYGPNGGGKSNAVKAVMCLISTVLKPVYETRTNRQSLVVPLPIIPCVPFCFEDGAENE
ncbi:MAG: AAA family ATPase, partial [Eubacteriales bacterium]|nr:AAA family ATPase [Eubacteriales bacterium]